MFRNVCGGDKAPPSNGISPQGGRRVVAAVCMLALALPLYAADPFEPTVSRSEAALLEAVLTQSGANLNAAIAQLRDAAGGSASPALDYTLGNLYAQTNRLDEAVAAYGEALRKLPRFRAALHNLARVYLMQDRPEQAIEVFTSLVRDGQADADALIFLGNAFTLSSQSLSAEEAYRQALLLAPTSTDARRGLARSLLDQERYTEANAILKELLLAQPAEAELWSLRANTSLTRDKPVDALVCLELARRLGVASPDMLATLGDLYLNREQAGEAVAAYEAAFAGGGATATRQLRAVEGLLQVGEWERAESLLQKVDTAALSPLENRQHQQLRASLLHARGRADEARAAYVTLLRENPLDGDALLALGDLERESGKLEEAHLTYERAARLPGFEARSQVRTAQVEVERGRYADAVRLLESAQTLDAQPHVARYLEQVRRLVVE